MRKDIYQTWKNEGLVQSKLKLIKELASRSCGMGVIATELGVAESTLYSLRKKYKEIYLAYEDGRNLLKKALLEKCLNVLWVSQLRMKTKSLNKHQLAQRRKSLNRQEQF
ncbi:MAG: hypothetical protein M0P32_05760 [Bacteroidales bacterium]|nr:hypothetical protein [Bacteroidales bacterium]